MAKYVYTHCEVCHTYSMREVDDKTFNELENLRLIYRKSKVFIICEKCLNKMKEGGDNE